MEVSLNDTYWDRVDGFVTELKVDARWILRKEVDDKPYGKLRIVSHPDLKPGHLRAYFNYVVTINKKTKQQKLQAIEDYQMDELDLEVYSVDEEKKTETKTYVDTLKNLNDMFGVDIMSNK